MNNFDQVLKFFSQYHEHPNLMSVVFEIAIVLLITVIVSYCTERVLNRLQGIPNGFQNMGLKIRAERLKCTKTYMKTRGSEIFKNQLLKGEGYRYKQAAPWDNAIVASIKRPVHFIIWVLGLTHSLELANSIIKLEVLKNISTFREVSIVFSISWFLLGLVAQLELKWNQSVEEKSSKLDKTTVGAITKLLKVTTFIIATLMILETLGFSISGILAFGSISGAGVSFAAKDLLANFFGALMIYLDKPFKEGDWIKIKAKGIEGIVEKVGLRCTIIRTMDKCSLYVPNSIFAVAAIENPSRMTHRRIKEIIGIRHEDVKVVDKITQDIEKALKSNPLIDQKQPIVVYLEEFSETSLNILIYSYTKSVALSQFAGVKHNIMLDIAKIIAKHNAKIATASSIGGSSNNGNTDAGEEDDVR